MKTPSEGFVDKYVVALSDDEKLKLIWSFEQFKADGYIGDEPLSVAARVMLLSDSEVVHIGATNSTPLQHGREFSEAQWIAAARAIEAHTIETAIETAQRYLHENTVAVLCRMAEMAEREKRLEEKLRTMAYALGWIAAQRTGGMIERKAKEALSECGME